MAITTGQRWTVGAVTITSVVEDEIHHIPPELFFPGATAAEVAAHPELVPDFVDADGNIAMRVQALIVEVGDRTIVVDPCVGNDKKRLFPFWNEMTWPFLERFDEAGYTPETIDTVVHTHLHADHVGWDTRLVDGEWIPTFANARHLYTEAELEFARRDDDVGVAGVFADSIDPILAAGLADVIATDADLGDGLALEPSLGHTPGHVSLWISSAGETGLITGDFMHHPVQCKVPSWAEVGDVDPELARETRRRMLTQAAERRALVIGTHFPTRPAGHVLVDGETWRFEPL